MPRQCNIIILHYTCKYVFDKFNANNNQRNIYVNKPIRLSNHNTRTNRYTILIDTLYIGNIYYFIHYM